MQIEDILAQIPDIQEFMSVEEMDESTLALAKKYPELASVDIVGKSRKQHPLYCLKIGNGKKTALMYGCPHPNEPIGCMMLEQLSQLLCKNPEFLKQLDTTFYIIKAIDTDGLDLNKGWLKGPFTYSNYVSHFFRPNTTQQVEWTFPFQYKNYEFHEPIPETQTVMKLMEQLQPDFVYSLHNSSFGGVYWYVSHNRDDILSKLPKAAERVNLPLNLGEPECPFSKTFAPAIYEFLRSTQYYDYYEQTLDGNPAEYMAGGGSSLDYMQSVNPDAFVMMCEEPYFYCPDSSDLSLCKDVTRRESILEGMEKRKVIVAETIRHYEVLKQYADLNTMYMRALAMYADAGEDEEKAQIALMNEHPEEFDVPATIASRFDGQIASPWYPLLAFGMLMGAAKETLETITEEAARQTLQNLIRECQCFIEKQCEQIQSVVPCQPIAIRKLVSVQMESAFIVLDAIKAKEDTHEH